MLDLIKKLFGRRTVVAVEVLLDAQRAIIERTMRDRLEAKDQMISTLKNEIDYLRAERKELQTLFNRALRLEPREPSQQRSQEPANQARNTWGNVKKKLEEKHAIPPEDRTHDYWKKVNERLTQQAGITQDEKVILNELAFDPNVSEE